MFLILTVGTGDKKPVEAFGIDSVKTNKFIGGTCGMLTSMFTNVLGIANLRALYLNISNFAAQLPILVAALDTRCINLYFGNLSKLKVNDTGKRYIVLVDLS